MCDFPEECVYHLPTQVGTQFEDPCNGLSCVCCTLDAAAPACGLPANSNKMECANFLIGCTFKVPVCHRTHTTA